MPQPKQPVTDDSIQVRQLSHYQFTWVAGEPSAPGTWTLQLVLDQGAWEEVLTVDPHASLEFLQLLCRLVAKRLREIDEKVIGWRIMAGQSDAATA